MSIGPEHETPRPSGGADGFSDAVTFAFGDREAGVFGIARTGFSGEPATASGLALLFAGGQPVAVRADSGVEPSGDPSWDAVEAAGIVTETVEPLRSWRVRFAAEDGAHGFELAFEAVSEPATLDADNPAARTGGMEGYEQLCRVTGTATVAGREVPVNGLGQRGHSWGAPDWDGISLARTIGAWFGDGLGVSISAIRPAGAKAHSDEAVGAFLFAPVAPAEEPEGAEGSDPVAASEPLGDALSGAVAIFEPLLSTTYDADERQLRAGMELYVNEDDGVPHRAAGEVLCGTTLDLGRLRLDCAFFAWRMEGHEGIGRYDVLRRTA